MDDELISGLNEWQQTNRRPINTDNVWFWYVHILAFKKDYSRSAPEYCSDNNISIGFFNSYKSKIFSSTVEKYIPLYKEWEESGLTRTDFLRKKNISSNSIKNYLTIIKTIKSLQYIMKSKGYENVDDIDLKKEIELTKGCNLYMRHENEKEPQPLSFIGVKKNSKEDKKESLTEPQGNAVEIIVQKGIKLVIEHEVAPEKLIKIIEIIRNI